MRRILVLDNYDSFTFNLVHLLAKLTDDPVDVFRNDEITIAGAGIYDKIILSPGPGLPGEAGILKSLVETYSHSKSILGVCLGMQAIAEVFGGSLENMDIVFHGVATPVTVIDKDDTLFCGIPPVFTVGRYHSWKVSERNFPACLKITCRDEYGTIMALSHSSYRVKGVQFHPESILTEFGERVIANWLCE